MKKSLFLSHKITNLFFAFFLLLSNILLSASAFALPEHLLDYYNNHDILYYDPTNSATDCEIPQGTYDGIETAGLSPLQAEFTDKNYPIAQKLSQEYKIPWETVVAQGILESASGTSNFAINRNNFFGIGAFDNNPDNAFYYKSYSDGWRGYYENIRKTSVYRANGAFNFPNDPYGYLKAIKKAGYASAENYVPVVSKLIRAIELRGIEKGWQLSRNNPSTTPLPESIQDSSINIICTGNSTKQSSIDFNGNHQNINDVAVYFSHPFKTVYQTPPKDAYKQALEITGVNRLGDSCSMRGQSCDAFVATVLRYTKTDPNIPCCGARRMMNYFLSHPEKYTQIPNIGNTSNLQAGDIRSKSSHVEIIINNPSGSGFKIAAASHCEHTADHYSNFYNDSEYYIFRLK